MFPFLCWMWDVVMNRFAFFWGIQNMFYSFVFFYGLFYIYLNKIWCH
uniref:Uncharacterized protein n=1 Tax=Anguilla anguilla TaxID=7936 RepID=A0A0E9TXW3_ANGAN